MVLDKLFRSLQGYVGKLCVCRDHSGLYRISAVAGVGRSPDYPDDPYHYCSLFDLTEVPCDFAPFGGRELKSVPGPHCCYYAGQNGG